MNMSIIRKLHSMQGIGIVTDRELKLKFTNHLEVITKKTDIMILYIINR